MSILILGFLGFSCLSYSNEDFELSESERTHLNTYKKGDTLFFKNAIQAIDTILILGMDSSQKREPGTLMAKPASNDLWVSIKHIRPLFWKTFSSGKVTNIDTASLQDLVRIIKRPQSKEVNYYFNFRHFSISNNYGLGTIHSDTIIINKVPITQYYTLENKDIDSLNSDVIKLFWDINKKIIAYQLIDSSYWLRVNGS